MTDIQQPYLPDSANPEEKVLLMKIAEGDEVAFRIIFDQYREDIFIKAFYFLKSASLAEDVLQEVFLKIWKNKAKVIEIQNFKAFLQVVARNVIFGQLRKNAAQSLALEKLGSHTVTSTSPAIIQELENKELRNALQKAMELLTPRQRQVFELSRLQGLTHAEIAIHLKMNKETVKKHITDALRVIRSSLETLPSLEVAIGLFWIMN